MSANPIGHRIRARRKSVGLTQTALAKRVGVSVSYMNLIEHDRRSIGGALLRKLGDALDLDPGALDGAAERRMLQELDEMAADPSVAHLQLPASESRELVTRFESWARALIAMRRSAIRDQQTIAALSDRLNHDPFLSEAVHRMLSAAAAIRSVTDIYADEDELETDQRDRFDSILAEESSRLSEVAQSLAGFFDELERPGHAATAAEEVDDLLQQRRNHFPALENAAEALRLERALGERPEVDALRQALERVGVRIEHVPAHTLPRWRRFDAAAGVLEVAEGAPVATLRFEVARALCAAALAGAVEAEIADAPELVSEQGRARARGALAAYAAACLLMPYAPFHAAAEESRYDIDALSMRFGVSSEQLCHRFTTLRRPGEEGVLFGFMRANAAGYLTKRFSLPRMPLPRFGGACPLLAVYAAMQTPDVRLRQLVEFPNNDRFFIVAKATRPRASGFGRTQPSFALMLTCDAIDADRLIYSEGLDVSPGATADPVGPTCALCPRVDCAHRQEDSIRPAQPL